MRTVSHLAEYIYIFLKKIFLHNMNGYLKQGVRLLFVLVILECSMKDKIS